MRENIKQFKLSTGEEIICEVIHWDTEETTAIIVRKAMKLCDSVNMRNGYKFFSFRPWLSFSDDPDILQTVNSEHVIGETAPSPELINLYDRSIERLLKFLEDKEQSAPINLDHLSDLTDDEVHEYLEKTMDNKEINDSDEPSNILQFPKTFH